MTTDELVFNTLSDAGVPTARMLWGPHPPEPPYAVYSEIPQSMFTDNRVIVPVPKYRCTLYLDEYDEDVIERFKLQVASLGTYVRHSDTTEDGLIVVTFDVNVTRRSDG